MQTKECSATDLIYDIVIDWLYILTTGFAICLCLWLLYFFAVEYSVSFVYQGACFVEAHKWQSSCFVGLVVYAIKHSHQK